MDVLDIYRFKEKKKYFDLILKYWFQAQQLKIALEIPLVRLPRIYHNHNMVNSLRHRVLALQVHPRREMHYPAEKAFIIKRLKRFIFFRLIEEEKIQFKKKKLMQTFVVN